MRKTQKILALLMAVAMLLAMSVSSLAVYDPEAYEAAAKKVTELTGDYTGKTVILHSNDVHGQVDGYAYMPTLEAKFKELGASDVVIVDAGDFTQGDIYVSTSKGASAVELMNAAGYDVITLGNHEFDFGYAQLKENLDKAEFKVVCADVVLEDGSSIYDGSYTYETATGLKLGFFGMETPETATKVNPGLIKEINFVTFDALYTCAQAQIDALKEGGADLIIGLTHLGVNDESAANGYRSIDLYAKTEGADILIDGHSHTVMTGGEGGEPIQSTGTKFANVGVVVIDDESKTIEDCFLVPTEGLEKDETVAAAAQKIMDAVDEEYNSVFAVSLVDLNGERDPGNRTEETNLGDLICDAMVWSVLDAGGIDKVPVENVIGITNGGGIRASIAAGEISKKDINTVLPFGNTVAVIYVTGAELLEALEASTFDTPQAIGGYPQVSGVQFNIDVTKPYDQGELYVLDGKETTYYAPASISRVEIVSVNGQDFDPEAMYAVVTNNFIAAGGDTYAVFHTAYERDGEFAGFDTGIPMDEAVMDFISTELEGTVDFYGMPVGWQGRIIFAPDKSSQALTVNGESKSVDMFNADGYNLLRLRDVALMLDGTGAQFNGEVVSGTYVLTTGEPFVPQDDGAGDESFEKANKTVVSLVMDDVDYMIDCYIMDGIGFFMVRDLADLLGFSVDYNEATRTVEITTP